MSYRAIIVLTKGVAIVECTDELAEDREQEKLCDWCGRNCSQGTFFVPGRGIFNLCSDCRVFLTAVLLDGG